MKNKFEEFGLSRGLLETIRKVGFKEPTEIQEKAIPPALKGRDVIGGSATGSGKTLAFSVPIIENLKPNGHVQALVLVPTRELADQVMDSISLFSRSKHFNVIEVYGGVSIEVQIRKIPHADIIVATPGRILDHLNRNTLDLGHVKFLVLDEVDRMLDMGFYQDVKDIIDKCPKERQTMMFSATVSADLIHLAERYAKNPIEVSVKSYIDYSQLKQVFYDVPSQLKFSLLVHLLKKEKAGLVMVFCSTRNNADFVANNLKRNGIRAQAIHGGLNQSKRTKIIDSFKGSGGPSVLVCTDVAARGLDIKNVTHVYNYDLPKTSKEYIHRIGRTARAGKNGKAISILSSRDYENFREITRDESLKITQENLPRLERVSVKVENRRGRGFRNQRNFRNHSRRRFH